MADQTAGSSSGHAMPKANPEAIERFRRVASSDPRVSLRPMFGHVAAFANGYMFAGVFGDDVFVRLDDADQASVIAQGGGPFAPMPGRPMRGYVVLPEAVSHDDERLRAAIETSLAYTLALPPKPPKPPKGKGQ